MVLRKPLCEQSTHQKYHVVVLAVWKVFRVLQMVRLIVCKQDLRLRGHKVPIENLDMVNKVHQFLEATELLLCVQLPQHKLPQQRERSRVIRADQATSINLDLALNG